MADGRGVVADGRMKWLVEIIVLCMQGAGVLREPAVLMLHSWIVMCECGK